MKFPVIKYSNRNQSFGYHKIIKSDSKGLKDDFGFLPSFLNSNASQFYVDKTKPKILNENNANSFISETMEFDFNIRNRNFNQESISLSNLTIEKKKELDPDSSKMEDLSLERDLNCVYKELRVITKKIRENEEYELKSLEWKFAAMVIDRFCFLFFAISTILSDLLILLTCENFFKSSDPDPQF
jgi:hypothetical protein